MPDPAAGKFEIPGGHIEGAESPRAAATREWQEETGLNFPDGEWTGTWTSANGIYQGFVYTIASEADLDIFDRQIGSDPDGDVTGSETIAWWDPADLPCNTAIRPELLADIDAVIAALGCPDEGDEATCPCGTPVVYDEMNGWQHADGSISHDDGASVSGKMAAIAKAYPDGQDYGSHAFRPDGDSPCCWYCGMARIDPFHGDYPDGDVAKSAITNGGGGGAPSVPKGRKARHWPGWDLDLQAVGHWAPLLAAALSGALTKAQAERIARAYIAEHPAEEQGDQGKREAVDAAAVWLAGQGLDLVPVIAPLVPGILADAHLIGGASAAAMTDGGSADLGGWQPGDTNTAQQRVEALGLGASLSAALATSDETAQQMAGGYMTRLGRALVDGVTSGLGAVAIGASLVAVLADRDNSSGSVLGQLVIGIGAAALALYLLRQIQYGEWLNDPASNVCPGCLLNAAAGRVRMGQAYPSGDADAPAHPSCRCQVVPA
jgi:ADP-ribose pyrophosphatase YjhB (NUDIX family)